MRFAFLFPAVLFLAGCTSSRAVNAPPIVDMRGVDQAKYNIDISECTEEKINTKFPYSDWPIITRCMGAQGLPDPGGCRLSVDTA